MGSPGDPKASTTAYIGFISALIVFIIIIGLHALYLRAEQAQIAKKVYSAVPAQLSRIESEQIEKLNTYRWVDEGRGVVSIPIDRAMDLVVAEARRPGSLGMSGIGEN